MSYVERKSYIDHIRLIGCPYTDQKRSNIDLKYKDIEMLRNELKIQKKQISNINTRIEQAVFKFKKKHQYLMFFPFLRAY